MFKWDCSYVSTFELFEYFLNFLFVLTSLTLTSFVDQESYMVVDTHDNIMTIMAVYNTVVWAMALKILHRKLALGGIRTMTATVAWWAAVWPPVVQPLTISHSCWTCDGTAGSASAVRALRGSLYWHCWRRLLYRWRQTHWHYWRLWMGLPLMVPLERSTLLAPLVVFSLY